MKLEFGWMVMASSALLLAKAAWAQDAANVPRPVPQCVMCHGPLGHSVIPDAPHLAGQPQLYLVSQLKAFRNGSRQHAVMNVIAKPLTDEEIAAAAAWFSAVTPEGCKP